MPQTRTLAVQPRLVGGARAPVGQQTPVEVELVAAIIAVVNDEPVVRVVSRSAADGLVAKLPSAAYRPDLHPTLEVAVRSAVRDETGLELGYIEQLDSIMTSTGAAPNGHGPAHSVVAPRTLSIGYLALAFDGVADAGEPAVRSRELKSQWQSCYTVFPWEDWRRGKPAVLSETIEPRLDAWVRAAPPTTSTVAGLDREQRVRMCFGTDTTGWDEEKVLDRYDLLCTAGLLDAATDAAHPTVSSLGVSSLGVSLTGVHRRSLATAITRLRSKIKYRPVVFDLMPDLFTLFELQRTVEAILGPHLHKQNFRRLVEHMGLVEPTSEVKTHTGGRPAKLFRFRQSVVWERMQPGLRVRGARV